MAATCTDFDATAVDGVDGLPTPAHSQPLSIETLIDILIADPDRFDKTPYVEKGVPMFLVGEGRTSNAHTTSSAHTRPRGGVATDSLGARLAELAGVLALRKPQLDLGDVGRLMEVLADRHFLSLDAGLPDEAAMQPPTELVLPASAPPALRDLISGMALSRTIRIVNFHATPRYREAEYRRQIAVLAEAFEPITPANFADAVEGRWAYERPGLMPALFEGYRDNLDVLLPILEEFGFTGWLFVPSGFLNVPAHEQRNYAASHELHLPEIDEYPGSRIAITWDEARDIARRGHAFACHTRTHNQLVPGMPRDVLRDEIITAKAELEAELGTGVEMFCWLGGAELGFNPEADEMLRLAGFRYLFSNFKVQKLK